ncbi:MAG: TIR domain-containing protein [Candidatus Diapherotrites archaeon]|nr:TIR domain-containing protein [Candidatus Diapherotrites archaeon]
MGGGYSTGRTSYAEQRYKEKIPNSPTLNNYNSKPKGFISFHIEDEARVNFLRSQAKDGQLEFIDYSVKEPFDDKWKTQCTERLKQSDITIVMIGAETHKREAVDWEIRKAHELGKPVIGIRIYRDKNHTIPQALTDIKAKIMYWNLEEIQKQIDKKT